MSQRLSSNAPHTTLGWSFVATLLVLLHLLTGCRAEPPTLPASADPTIAATDAALPNTELQSAIQRSARYLADACAADGRFVYRINLDPTVKVAARYNVLRHAGAVYALAQYCQDDCQQSPDARVKTALLRAAKFLRRECIAPAANNPNLLAVWSDPKLVGGTQPRQAKLGGTGLGLVALLEVEKIEPGFTPVDELRKLGRFLVYMQKSDGSFYSKYFPSSGRNDTWHSVYYPGEASLGLLMLYEHDRATQWLHTATKALTNLAHRAKRQPDTFPDQWYLLALGHWLTNATDPSTSAEHDTLLDHARRLCRDMVREQQEQLEQPRIAGCFTPEGRTCPSATRLEGLIAALQYLPDEDTQLRRDVRTAVQLGVPFLLSSQVHEGPYAGALPRFKPGFEPNDIKDAEKPRLQEVRIDYVQHALSALLAYRRLGLAQPTASERE